MMSAMTGMSLFFIVLYAACSVVHVVSCALEKDTLSAWTKCLLMPLLAVVVISFALHGRFDMEAVREANAPMSGLPSSRFSTVAAYRGTPPWLLAAAALLCGTTGDALLIHPTDGKFMAGAACFIAGHIAWMLTMKNAAAVCSAANIAVWAAVSAVLLYFVWRILGRLRGVMGAGVVIYGLVLLALIGTGIAAVRLSGSLSITSARRAAVMFLAGGVLFFISDGVLAYDRFAKRVAHSDFIVMLTYIAAQTLLAASVVSSL